MFETALLETTAARPARTRATAVSITLQAAALAAVFALPLIFPATLRPEIRPSGVPTFYRAPKHVTIISTDRGGGATSVSDRNTLQVVDNRFRYIPSSGRARTDADEQPPCITGCTPHLGNGPSNGAFDFIGNTAGPTVKLDPPKRVRISNMQPGAVLRRVQPDYPITAKATQTQGAVVLRAIIGRDGLMQSVQVIEGHPLLVQAAKQAVAQWRYRPYLLNGTAVEVETQITVNFKLGSQ